MNDSIKMTLNASWVLNNVINNILYQKKENSEEFVERDFTFKVKYKLQRNQAQLIKDVEFINKERNKLLEKYGTVDKEKNLITVNPENKEIYIKEISNLVNTVVEHSFFKFTPEEVFSFGDTPAISTDEMDLFITLLVDDPELKKDLREEIKIQDPAEISESSKNE